MRSSKLVHLDPKKVTVFWSIFGVKTSEFTASFQNYQEVAENLEKLYNVWKT